MHSRGLYIQTENETAIDILMVAPDGKEKWISNINPVKDLLAAIEIDYSAYRKRIMRLHDLPLFQEKLDIAMWEYEELINSVRKIPNLIEAIDPVGAFVVRRRIEMILQHPDDGSAMYLLQSGQWMIDVLMEPVLTQIRLRNIFEVTFATTERKTQAERYHILRDTYPQLFELKGFTAQKTEQTGESILERLVKQDLTFDPARRYFDVQTLDLEEPNPQWKIMTAEEWMRSEQGSRRPLAEQAEEIHPRKIDEEE